MGEGTVATCTNCRSENEAGRKFCGECGASLAIVCPSCASPNSPNVKFCGECGSPLGIEDGVTSASSGSTAPQGPIAERRLVSVLFADLVGFTTLSESRDPEEVRDLLSRYFEIASELIERYGGTVEKFIGDAVMAVWGAPVAHEDDAERAVRAGLELVEAVATMGRKVRADELRSGRACSPVRRQSPLGRRGRGWLQGTWSTQPRVFSQPPPQGLCLWVKALISLQTRRSPSKSRERIR
jgi:Adenylate and Guanylate cyclase catalytic domain/Double zinc ribbon